ncbi:ATP-binding cassette domain-containing protein [Kribbella catacumbae]|uniref:ATP-binding cassette domain-containing protein n=1 Tax=Kribbella catacumbae TaxID=460086 RepID=UPI00036CBE67|nr:sugar ABC transporter ATP-binding protein [Kribbella catacumbae]
MHQAKGSDPAVVVRGVTMTYGATVALDDVDLTIRRGVVTAVVGANGSGKTTLLRVVCGVVHPTSGTVAGPGRALVKGLAAAQRAGIVLVPQEPTVAGHLPVWQNIALGRPEARRGPFLADRAARAYAARHLAGLLPDSVLNVPTATLSKSARQLVQLAAAMARHPEVLMLDEPTAVLDENGVEMLHALIRRFVGAGGTVAIVSHRLRDVLELADDVVVLRNGKVSHTGAVGPGTEQHVVQLLSAAERPDQARHRPDLGHVVLEARGLRGWRGLAVDHLVAHSGEIVGVAGQSGSGRSRLASVLAGAWPAAAGEVTVEGRPLRLGDIRSAQTAGVAYIPEDRQQTGILANLPVSANLLVGRDDAGVRWGPFRRRAAERAASTALIERFEVRPAEPERPAALLSGGNQQKLVVGRALARGARLVVADEPTQGVDASARAAIHAALAEAAAAGSAVVAVCSEFDELFEISDRVVVLRDGRIVLDRPVGDVTQDEVLAASLGSDVEESQS